VTVNVTDVNDCPPIIVFPSPDYNDSISISALKIDNGINPIATVIATDRDADANAKLSYNIAGWKYTSEGPKWRNDEEQVWHTGSGQFSINATTGAINVLRVGMQTDRASGKSSSVKWVMKISRA
jgi:hypothetical protein